MKEFNTKEELFKHLKENKELLIAEKKSVMKMADAVSFVNNSENNIQKTTPQELLQKDSIKVKAVINTTNILDSHRDVHISGLWDKSIKERKNIYHLQEHKMDFSHLISKKVNVSTEKTTFKNLGYNLDGETEALIFNSEIEKSQNKFMFEQYSKGNIDNHSVGMNYVKLYLCINSNDDDYKEEKTNWDKYISNVANKEEAENIGYFWAVTEAKLIEGSAVLIGSNWATPTQEVKFEPSSDTQKQNINEPLNSTQKSLFEKLVS